MKPLAILFKLAGILVATGGTALAFNLFYPSDRMDPLDQMRLFYLEAARLRCWVAVLAAVACGYVLFRTGSHLAKKAEAGTG